MAAIARRVGAANGGDRLGPDVEALILTFCTAQPVAAIGGCCRESFCTTAIVREHWQWRFINALFLFIHAENRIGYFELEAEAEIERAAFRYWFHLQRQELREAELFEANGVLQVGPGGPQAGLFPELF